MKSSRSKAISDAMDDKLGRKLLANAMVAPIYAAYFCKDRKYWPAKILKLEKTANKKLHDFIKRQQKRQKGNKQ